MSIKLRLVGCDRYNVKGELYEKGKVYMVNDTKAKILLNKEDTFGRPYFAQYFPEAGKSKNQRIAEAAAKAATKAAAIAAKEEEVVDRIIDAVDPNEVPDAPFDPDASVDVTEEEVVDTDDDPDLDEDNEPNPEEIDEDRDDGSAVEV